jgi:hypothetical protein
LRNASRRGRAIIRRANPQSSNSRVCVSGYSHFARPEDTEPKSISERTSRNRRAASYLCADAVPASPEGAMIYIVAFLLPPLGLLLNGQPFSAIFNLVLLVPCLLLGFIFPPLWLVPSLHAVIAVHMRREDRKHRQIVEAIEKHGPPPWWLR